MPCNDRDKLLYNIRELPEVFNIEPVDLFVVETLDGTSIVSFDNIIIDLPQTTFEVAFNKHTTDIISLSSRLGTIESIVLENDEANKSFKDSVASDIISAIYPIGSLYITIVDINPQTHLNVGTWVKRSTGRFLAGVGEGFDINGEALIVEPEDDISLGEYKHQLKVDEMPKHNHDNGEFNRFVRLTGHNTAVYVDSIGGDQHDTLASAEILPTGGDKPHNNIPPYFGVYVWERVS